ncbi:uncharacterized protein LOC118738330 [Rhagoletis pomonella]|nr:uncharacterized protein LOC118738330 [Rhagoletis pomonella]
MQPSQVDEPRTIPEILEELRSLKAQTNNNQEANQKLVQRLTEEVITLQTEIRELKKLHSVESDVILLPSQPFISLACFEEFDSKLLANEEIRVAFKEAIQKVGGNSAPCFLKMAIKSIIADELAVGMTWRGTAEKPSFQKFATFQFIKDICHIKFSNLTDLEINKICQQRFLHARDRICKRQKRMTTNK